MLEKFKKKNTFLDEESFQQVVHEVSTAAMKYALVSVGCRSTVSYKIIVSF